MGEREYNMAALGLKKDRELAATEQAREFIMRNAMTMVSHVERQCNLTQRAHQLRQKHRREDAAGATGVAQLVRELTATIVEGIQSSGSPDALAGDVKGNTGSIDWKESAADVGAAATEIRKEAEAVAADVASTSTTQ